MAALDTRKETYYPRLFARYHPLYEIILTLQPADFGTVYAA